MDQRDFVQSFWGCFTHKLRMLTFDDKLDEEADLNKNEEQFFKRVRKLAVRLPGYYAKEVLVKAKEAETKDVEAKEVQAKEVQVKEVFVKTTHETIPHARINVTEPEKEAAEEMGKQQSSTNQFSSPDILLLHPRDQPGWYTCLPFRGPKGPA